jgi:Kef-type K+ transport system membrane component KefB
MFVSLMPFLFLVKNIIYSLVILFFILAALVVGSKRGALFIGLLIALLTIYFQIKHVSGKDFLSKAMNVVVVLLVLCAGVYFLFEVFESNYYVLERFKKNESTRPANYLALWNNWLNSDSILNYIFGYGFFSSMHYTPERVLAHNDWLEMLNDFGLVGILFYVILIYGYGRLFTRHKDLELKYMHLSVLIIWLFISFFSMWMNNYVNVMYAILMGYLIGSLSKRQNNKTM